jgi:nitrate/TMAO reductase-like tetraheme cytochrome c subunit
VDPTGPLFHLPDSPAYLWLVGLVFAIPAIAIAVIGLVRGRLPAALGLTGAILVPVFAYVVGGFFVLEKSKSVRFCGSCHETMSPLVASLPEDNGSLASIHWQSGAVSHADACFQCHSGYGIWGTVDAKFAGVRHMILTVTGGYKYPLHARSFDIASCLGCHAEAVPFRAQPAHQAPEVQQQLLAGELSCAGTCHPDAHPADALMGASARATR